MKTLKITARRVVADSRTILDNASVIVHDGLVVEIGPAESLSAVHTDRNVNLPDGVLHPGFVNAHCHLELSFMKGRLRRRRPFTAWIGELAALRSKTAPGEVDAGVRAGIARLIQTGATCVGDVAAGGGVTWRLIRAGMRGVVFHETLGYDPAVAGERLEKLKERVAAAAQSERVVHGVSPHSVYSVSPALMTRTARYARRERRPLAIHLCETPEEADFTQKGSGPFRDLLVSFGVPLSTPPRRTPVNTAAATGALRGALAIHMNHPNRGDFATLAREGARVVLCPESNRWFGRRVEHPAPALIERGVVCALGTDSLASNTDLDMRAEMRRSLALFPELGARQVFGLATEGGARALGLPEGCGTLRPGAPFDAVVAPLKLSRRSDPLLAIIKVRENVSQVWIGGRNVYRNR